MPSCISVFTNVDFTAVALSAPQDGFSIAVAMATPTPTPGPTSGPTATPAPSPSDTPIPTASPTETPSPSPSETPLPTPSPTSAALCISVDGSTNGFGTAQLSSPDNGFSFANNNIVNPTPTPSPTPASGPIPITGSSDPCTPTVITNVGGAYTYEVTLNFGTINNPAGYQWFSLPDATYALFIPNAVDQGGGSTGIRQGYYGADDCSAMFASNSCLMVNVAPPNAPGGVQEGKQLNHALVGLAYSSAGAGPWNIQFAVFVP